MSGIQVDSNGYYYNETNQYGCWGNWNYIQGRYEPDEPHMLNNAWKIYNQLRNAGWDIRPICAVIGNMCAESYLNAGQTQNGYAIGAVHGGFGLVMWTPQTVYRNWAQANNHNVNLAYWQVDVVDTLDNGYVWIDTIEYPLTYTEFKGIDSLSVEYLTKNFYASYERGPSTDESMWYRVYCANYYATQFFGYDPEDPSIVDPPQPDPEPPESGDDEPYKRYSKKGMPIWEYPVIKNRRG